jgi:hypothetical protein
MKPVGYVLSARYHVLHNAALRCGSSFVFVVGVYFCVMFVVFNWYTVSAPAPMEGAVSMAAATWQSLLLGHLEHHKRYPREAQRNREEAVVYGSRKDQPRRHSS